MVGLYTQLTPNKKDAVLYIMTKQQQQQWRASHLQLEPENQAGPGRRPQPKRQPGDAPVSQLGRRARPERVEDNRRRGRAEVTPPQRVSRSDLESVRLCLVVGSAKKKKKG